MPSMRLQMNCGIIFDCVVPVKLKVSENLDIGFSDDLCGISRVLLILFLILRKLKPYQVAKRHLLCRPSSLASDHFAHLGNGV